MGVRPITSARTRGCRPCGLIIRRPGFSLQESGTTPSTEPDRCNSSFREEGSSELPGICRRPPVVPSAQFGDHGQSRPHSRPHYRNRGIAIARAAPPPLAKAIVPVTGWARLVAVETNRPVEAVIAAQLKPDGSRGRVLSHRSRASKDAALHRHTGPADRRHTPRSAAAASPGEAVASSPRARALPLLVQGGGRC